MTKMRTVNSIFCRNQIRKKSIILLAIIFVAVLFVQQLAVSQVQAESVIKSYGYTKITDASGGYAYGTDVATTDDGSVYVVGEFQNTVDFDPSAGIDNHTSSAGTDSFLSKYNADGSYIYTKTWGASGAEALAVDSQGNAYIGSCFTGTIDFDPGAGVENRTSNGNCDAYALKITAAGNFAFVKTWGSTGIDYSRNLAIDHDDNLYVGDVFQDTVDFDPGAGTDNHISLGSFDSYISKYNPDGSYAYTKTWGGLSVNGTAGIAFDADNNVFIADNFLDTVDFDPGAGTDNRTSNSSFDAALIKLNADGSYAYTKTWGGGDFEFIDDIAVDSAGAVYATGVFGGLGADFDPSVATDAHSSNGSGDAFATKLNNDGSYAYTKTWGGTGDDEAFNVAVDTSNAIHVVTNFDGSLDLDPNVGVDTKMSSGGKDVALSTLAADGSYVEGLTFGGTSFDYAYAVGVDSGGNLYLTGVTDSNPIDFNPFAGTDTQTPLGNGDMFLTKINQTFRQNIVAPAGNTITEVTSNDIADSGEEGVLRSSSVTLRLSTDAGLPLAEVTTNLTTDRDWSSVTSGIDEATHKSFVHNLTSAPGAASTFTLYVPKAAADNAVGICPGAASLAAVSPSCPNLAYYNEASDNTTMETISGKTYWKVSGLTGTGGFSTTQASLPGLPATGESSHTAGIYLFAAGVVVISGVVLRAQIRPKYAFGRRK